MERGPDPSYVAISRCQSASYEIPCRLGRQESLEVSPQIEIPADFSFTGFYAVERLGGSVLMIIGTTGQLRKL
jgi:hypothetical protein